MWPSYNRSVLHRDWPGKEFTHKLTNWLTSSWCSPIHCSTTNVTETFLFSVVFLLGRYADLECINTQLNSSKVKKMAMLLEAVESSYSPAFTNMQQDVLAGNDSTCTPDSTEKGKEACFLRCSTCLSEGLIYIDFIICLSRVVFSGWTDFAHVFTCQPWRRQRTSAPTWGPCGTCLRTWRAPSFLMSGVRSALCCTQCAWCGPTPDTTTPRHASSFCCRRPATSSYSRSAAVSFLCQSPEPAFCFFCGNNLCC